MPIVLLAHLIGDGCISSATSSSTRRPIPPMSKLSEPRRGGLRRRRPRAAGAELVPGLPPDRPQPTPAAATRSRPGSTSSGCWTSDPGRSSSPTSVFGLGRASIALSSGTSGPRTASLSSPLRPAEDLLQLQQSAAGHRRPVAAAPPGHRRQGGPNPAARWPRPAPGRHLGSRRADGIPRTRRLPWQPGEAVEGCGPSSSLGGPTPTST